MDDVVSVEASSCNTAAIKKDGSLWIWGNNGFDDIKTIPEKIMDGIKSVTLGDIVGNLRVSVIKNDGSLWVWGNNGYGQLGLGVSDSQYNTPQHLLPPDGYRFTSIDIGPGPQGGGHVLATLALVPEPTSLSILAIGAAGLLLRRRSAA